MSVVTHRWTELEPHPDAMQVPQLAFAAAALFGNDTLVVSGGNIHVHYRDERCYSEHLWLYNIGCNTWSIADEVESPVRGRFAHTMAIRDGAIFVFGGFAGVSLGDSMVYRPTPGWCANQGSQSSCAEKEACGFCRAPHELEIRDTMRHFSAQPGLGYLNVSNGTALFGLQVPSIMLETALGLTVVECAARCRLQRSCGSFEFMAVPRSENVSSPPTGAPTLSPSASPLSLLEGWTVAPTASGTAATMAEPSSAPTLAPSAAMSVCTIYSASISCAERLAVNAIPRSDSTIYEALTRRRTRCAAGGGGVFIAEELCPNNRTNNRTETCPAGTSCAGWNGTAIICDCDLGDLYAGACDTLFPNSLTPYPQYSEEIRSRYNTSRDAADPDNQCFATRQDASDFYFTRTENRSIFLSGMADAFPTDPQLYRTAQSSTALLAYPEHAMADWLRTVPNASTPGYSDACAITLPGASPWWNVRLPVQSRLGLVRLFGIPCRTPGEIFPETTRPTPGQRQTTMPTSEGGQVEDAPSQSPSSAPSTSVPSSAPTPEHADGCPTPLDYVNVSVTRFDVSGLESEPVACPLIGLAADGAVAEFDCSDVVGTITVQSFDPSGRALAICLIEAFADDPTGAAPENSEGVSCGAGTVRQWETGNCHDPCSTHFSCAECAENTGCSWCTESRQCQPQDTANCTAEGDTVAGSPGDCYLHIPRRGLVSEWYRFTDGTLRDAGEQRRMPAVVHHRPAGSELMAGAFPWTRRDWGGSSNTELLEYNHGFVVPEVTGNYTFWIRNGQGLECRLYLNPLGADRGGVQLIARQVTGDRSRPQVLWDLDPEQRSRQIFLQANVSYYIETNGAAFAHWGAHTIDVAWSIADLVQPTESDNLGPGFLRPPAGTCSTERYCTGCAALSNCMWCSGWGCVDKNESNLETCPTLVVDSDRCDTCRDLIGCEACHASDVGCAWRYNRCDEIALVIPGGDGDSSGDGEDEILECPIRCHSANNCTACHAESSCSWCESTKTCFEFSGYLAQFYAGGCRSWTPNGGACAECSDRENCGDCLADAGCGWCSNGDDAMQGRCVPGSYTLDEAGVCLMDGNISIIGEVAPALREDYIANQPNTTTASPESTTTATNNANWTSSTISSTVAPNDAGYWCSSASCWWDDFTQDVNWGYYSEGDADGTDDLSQCTVCQAACAADANCGAVECGGDYCAWWRVGSCTIEQANTTFDLILTCRSAGHADTMSPTPGPPPVPTRRYVLANYDYMTCPEVDECALGYHSCRDNSTCVDTPVSYSCPCNEGYASASDRTNNAEDGECAPQCPGCVHGFCAEPDVCVCSSGWSGDNCTLCQSTEICQGTLLGSWCVASESDAGTFPYIVPNATAAPTASPTASPSGTPSASPFASPSATPTQADTLGSVTGVSTTQSSETTTASPTNTPTTSGLSAAPALAPSQVPPPLGSVCTCPLGYAEGLNGATCVPVCSAGCAHGSCVAPDTCACDVSWAGDNCTACDSGVCDLNVSDACAVVDGAVTCLCHEGYESSGLECLPICEQDCFGNGECTSPGICECAFGFHGSGCGSCNETAAADAFGCHANASCAMADVSPTLRLASCECDVGYTGDGSMCTPVCSSCYSGLCTAPELCECDLGAAGDSCDQCDDMNALCGQNAACAFRTADVLRQWNESTSTASRPNVERPGLVNTTQFRREDVPFVWSPSLLQVSWLQVGYGTDAASDPWQCLCRSGYTGNGVDCLPVCDPACHSVHGICTAPDSCSCGAGWDGPTCTQCTNDTLACGIFAHCGNSTTGEGQICVCDYQYAGDPYVGCVPVCDAPCNFGDCIAPNMCSCEGLWKGPNCNQCETDRTAASPTPCDENAVCEAEGSDLGTCACNPPSEYAGDGAVCSPVCSLGCRHGDCTAPGVCTCYDGFVNNVFSNCTECESRASAENVTIGLDTVADIDEIFDRVHCGHFGACDFVASNTTAVCSCAPGYALDLSATNVNCTASTPCCVPVCSTPCANGICSAPNTCTCDVGWGGRFCDGCPDNHRCSRHGACVKGINGTLSETFDTAHMSAVQAFEVLGGLTDTVFNESTLQIVFREDDSPMYACACPVDFTGDGFTCEAVCDQGCDHGICSAPGVCECAGRSSSSDTDQSEMFVRRSVGNCALDGYTTIRTLEGCQLAAIMLELEDTVAEDIGIGRDNASMVRQSHYPHGCYYKEDDRLDIQLKFNPGGVANSTDRDRTSLCVQLPAWQGDDCATCIDGAHACDINARCLSEGSRRCLCDSGYFGDGEVCQPVCHLPCVHGTCSAPDTCTCDASVVLDGPAWTGPECTECVQQAHSCHPNATCSSEDGQLRCDCNEGWTGDGTNCDAICTEVDCGSHGHCSSPDICTCDLGWHGENCTVDCGCNFHSTCVGGPGVCDSCQDYTTGQVCELCAPGSWGDAINGSACAPCDCNGHGDCDPINGTCTCADHTTGNRCELCADGLMGNATASGTCYSHCSAVDNRLLLTDTKGAIMSNPSEACSLGGSEESCHAKNQVCSFLIQGDSNSSVMLDFEELELECVYDLVRVFDGPSQNSRLIGSFSGNEVPARIFSSSSSLLVHWYSDVDYVLGGFKATYTISSCPGGCSGHGNCSTATRGCSCDYGWAGDACAVQDCVDDDCAGAADLAPFGFGLSAPLLEPRAAHTTVYWAENDRFYTFGGFGVGNDLAHSQTIFGHRGNTSDAADAAYYGRLEVAAPDGSREILEPPDENAAKPSSRYSHSAVIYNSHMYIFGGAVGLWPSFGRATDELWRYDLLAGTWARRTAPRPPEGNNASETATVWPMAVYGHTATLVGSDMYIVGGIGVDGDFVMQMYKLNLDTGVWEDVVPGGSFPTAVFGHSAVHLLSQGTIVVYGGRGSTRMPTGRFMSRSSFVFYQPLLQDDLWIYDVATNNWRLGAPSMAPGGRFLHSAVAIGDLMIVSGGSPFTHERVRACHTNEMLAYDVQNDAWLEHNDTTLLGRIGDLLPAASIAHTLVLRTTATDYELFQFGGYDGRVLKDVWQATLPFDTATVLVQSGAGTTIREPSCDSFADCAACAGYQSPVTGDTPCKFQFDADDTDDRHQGISGRCLNMTARFELANSPDYSDDYRDNVALINSTSVGNAGLCDVCGSRPSCASCTDTTSPGRPGPGGSPGQCGWYQVYPFRFRFCISQFSVLRNQPGNVIRYEHPECPIPCPARANCGDCAMTDGCEWCDGSNECVSSDTFMSRAALGQCFRHQPYQQIRQCPESCAEHSDCHACSRQPQCGWCDAGGGLGAGLCVEGDSAGPFDGQCPSPAELTLGTTTAGTTLEPTANNTIIPATATAAGTTATDSTTRPATTADSPQFTVPPPSWAYFSCPNINECLVTEALGCNANATCTDIVREIVPSETYTPSIACDCHAGYTGDGVDCAPVCDMYGCDAERGRCDAPDVCVCETGWRGNNCTDDCGCNAHCGCAWIGTLPTCEDFTEGATCESCISGYYGDALDGGTCFSCLDACNGRTRQCDLDLADDNDTQLPVCTNCSGHFTGRLCDECEDGYDYESDVGRCFKRVTAGSQSAVRLAGSAIEGFFIANGTLSPGGHNVSLVFPPSIERGFWWSVGSQLPSQLPSQLLSTATAGGRRRATALSGQVGASLNASTQNWTWIAPSGSTQTILLPCTDFGFLTDTIFVQFSLTAGNPNFLAGDLPSRFSFGVQLSEARDLRCAACLDCAEPCSPGRTLDDDGGSCHPCQCNNHGDVCNSRTGVDCGLSADTCDPVTGANCACAHGTVTETSRQFGQCPSGEAADCQCNKCNSTFPQQHNLYNVSRYRPTEGGVCYRRIGFGEAAVGHAVTGIGEHWFVDYNDLRFTNLDARVVVYTSSGRVSVIATAGADFHWNTTTNYSVGSALYSQNGVGTRHVFDIESGNFDLDQKQRVLFFVHVMCDPGEDCAYSVYADQFILRLDLVVFFSMFAACFFLIMMGLFAAGKVRSVFTRRQDARDQAIELQQMAQRCLATVYTIIPDTSAAFRARGILKKPEQLDWVTPFSYQPLNPTKNPLCAICAFFVTLPDGRPSLAYGLVRLDTPLPKMRKRTAYNASFPQVSETRL